MRPNFVFILADDLGYANSSVCSPTRFALATGRWQHRLRGGAGVAPQPDYPLDGIDLLKENSNRTLFWRMKHRDQKAIRSGSWKWLSVDGHEYLFDLSKDQRERANLARRHSEKFAELKRRYLAWEASMPPIPADAKVSVLYGPADMPQAS